MKKNLFAPYLAALAVLLCAALLDGCQVVDRGGFDKDTISKAQRIEITNAATGEEIRVLETEEDIDAFVEAVNVGGWQLAEEPEGGVREGAFTLYQQSSVRALIGEGEERIVELCTLFSYQDAAYLTIGTGFLDITFSIPESAAEYLHSLVQ